MKKVTMKAGRKRKYTTTPQQIAVRVVNENDKRQIKQLERKLLKQHECH